MEHESVYIEINGKEVEAVLTFDYTPYERGKLSGLPENCFPYIDEEWRFESLIATYKGEHVDLTALIGLIEDDLIEQLKG